jgi:hypothetical protein
MRKKPMFVIRIVTAGLFAALAGGAYYAFKTPSGALTAARLFFGLAVHPQALRIGTVEGSLWQGVVLRNLELVDPQGLPAGIVLRIQELQVKIGAFTTEGISCAVVNGRLLVPEAETIMFDGSLAGGIVAMSLYTHQVHVAMLRELFPRKSLARDVGGTVRECEFHAQGTAGRLEIQGTLVIEEGSWKNIALRECLVAITAEVRGFPVATAVSGQAQLQGGTLSGEKTAVITLKPGTVQFQTKPQQVSLALHGTSTVERTKISIAVLGAADEPELRLSSDPPLPQDRLLLMVATGQSWDGEGTSPAGATAGDLVNYFLLGRTNVVTDTLKVDRFSVQLDRTKVGAKLEKDLSPQTSLKYEVNQKNDTAGGSGVTRTLTGDYQLSDNVSLEAERNVEGNSTREESVEHSFWLKFKKKY